MCFLASKKPPNFARRILRQPTLSDLSRSAHQGTIEACITRVNREIDLVETFVNCCDQLLHELFISHRIITLNHHAQQRFCSGIAHHKAPSPRQLSIDFRNLRLHSR